MKTHELFLILILLIIVLPCHAQITHTCKWACSFGSDTNEDPIGITTDLKGNMYVLGSFNDTIDFDCSSGVETLTPNLYVQSGFLTKYDSLGNFKWAQNIGKTSEVWLKSIASDIHNNIYVIGDGYPTFITTSGTVYLHDLGMTTFFAKLDTNGICLWARALIGTPFDQIEAHSNSISADSSGNVYIAGDFTGTLDFDPTFPATNYLTSTLLYTSDAFLAKYNSFGFLEWAVKTTGNKFAYTTNMIADAAGNTYFAGKFNDTIDIDPSPDTLLIGGIGANSNNIFFAKFNTNSQLIWANAIKNIGGAKIIAMDVNESEYINVVGSFADSIALVFEQPNNYLVASNTGYDNVFIARYFQNGIISWAKKYGSSGNISPNSIFLDNNNNSYVFVSNGKILKYTQTGSLADSILLSGISTSAFAKPYSNNNLFICGSYTGTLTIPSNTGNLSFLSKGGRDIVVARYDINTVGVPITDFKQPTINIYPNPVSEILSIELHSNKTIKGYIEVYNITGTMLLREMFNNIMDNNYIVDLNIEQLNSGMYFCKVIIDDKVFVKSFIKQNYEK